MSEIIPNGFSWSASRHEMFEQCPRAYFFHYYLALGQARDADRERVAEARRLRGLTNMWFWLGSRVHDALESLLKEAQRTRTRPDVVQAADAMLARMRADFLQSLNHDPSRDRPGDRCVRFHEHEYEQDPGKEVWKKAADDAIDMVHEFARLPYLDHLVSADPKDVLEIEQLRKWSFANCPVWVKIDLAYRDADGTVHVVDWKTGKWIREDNPIQLLGYASYVKDKWGTPLEKMAVREVYLRLSGEEKRCELNEGLFDESQDRILESIRSMLGALVDPNLNEALEDDFPTAPDERKCERCFFRRICPEVETG